MPTVKREDALKLLRGPAHIAVLVTTATANRRLEQAVATQFGAGVEVQRCPLVRESLVRMPGPLPTSLRACIGWRVAGVASSSKS